MANRLNVANIGYDDNNDALTIASDGTISAGTLGSGVVFPAGHVIQFENAYYNTLKSYSVTTSGVATDLTVGITPKYSGSKLLVKADVVTGRGYNYGLGFILKRTGPSSAESPVGATGTNKATTWHYSAGNELSSIRENTVSWVDTAQDNSTLHTYTLYLITNTAHTAYINRRNNDVLWGGCSFISVMEIKQ